MSRPQCLPAICHASSYNCTSECSATARIWPRACRSRSICGSCCGLSALKHTALETSAGAIAPPHRPSSSIQQAVTAAEAAISWLCDLESTTVTPAPHAPPSRRIPTHTAAADSHRAQWQWPPRRAKSYRAAHRYHHLLRPAPCARLTLCPPPVAGGGELRQIRLAVQAVQAREIVEQAILRAVAGGAEAQQRAPALLLRLPAGSMPSPPKRTQAADSETPQCGIVGCELTGAAAQNRRSVSVRVSRDSVGWAQHM
jgi:hypothetical protein